METQEDFDGKMVISVRGPITESFFKPQRDNVRWYCENARRFLPIEFDLEGAFNIRAERGLEFSEAIASVIESEGWRDTPSDEMAEIMGHGRLQLALLLNTEGGLVRIMDIIRLFIGLVRSRKGSVAAFGRGPVESVGAELFMNADEGQRFLEDRAHLMFHLTSDAYENRGGRGIVKKDGEQEWKRLCSRLRAKTESCLAVLGKSILYAEEHTDSRPDRPIVVSDMQAERFGWSETSGYLRRRFETVMGFSGVADYGRGSAVYNFFRTGNFTNFETVNLDRP